MTGPPLRILLVGDYTDDPRLGSAKVTHKLREELRAAGHHCDALFAGDIAARPAGRQARQLVVPVLAARAIGRALSRQPYDVVDVASAEGLWFGVRKRLGSWRSTAFVCRSNGLEHLNYRRMIDDSTAGLAPKPWSRRIWYPVSRLSQVAGAARLADRLIVLNETDRQFAIASRWLPADRIDVVPHGVSDRFLGGYVRGGPARRRRAVLRRLGSRQRHAVPGGRVSAARRAGPAGAVDDSRLRHSAGGRARLSSRGPAAARHHRRSGVRGGSGRAVPPARPARVSVDLRGLRARRPRSDEPGASGDRDAGRLRARPGA